MSKTVNLGGRQVGPGQPTYIIAEVGINHNGSLDIAKQLIDVAVHSGCDAVKFQKRDPELCIPEEMKSKMRETPWGYISYLDYRHRVELSLDDYREIDRYCRDKNIQWFLSCWDLRSIEFMAQFDTPCIKVPSAALTNRTLLQAARASGVPVMLSSGMSSMEQIRKAVDVMGTDDLLLAHSTSIYPCPGKELNLRMVQTLADEFDCPIGYSGHETGLATTVASVALGAAFVERHITLDRSMWGSDQAASVEPTGVARLVKDIRAIECGLGTGIKEVYNSEKPSLRRLRIIDDLFEGSCNDDEL